MHTHTHTHVNQFVHVHIRTHTHTHTRNHPQKVPPLPIAARRSTPRKKPAAKPVNKPAAAPVTTRARKGSVSSSTALVPAVLGNMPRPGDVIGMGPTGIWGNCQVVKVTNNFVHVTVLSRRATKTHCAVLLKPGMRVQMRLPPFDDSPTEMLFLAVGLVYTVAATTQKYRVVVFRRRVAGTQKWGNKLEMFNAASFPPSDRCHVSTNTPNTHSKTRTYTRTTTRSQSY